MRRRLAAFLILLLSTFILRAPMRAQTAHRWKPVSFEILEDWDKGDALSDVDADFTLFDQLGIHSWRGSLGWDDYETQRGQDDFAWLHQFADLADRHHIELHPYVGYTPGWAARAGASPKDAWRSPPAHVEDWARFAGDLASALSAHPNVRSFEIYNEENAKDWWTGSPEEYARVLVSGSRAIRSHNPNAPVLLGGLVYPDTRFATAVCHVPGAANAFSVLPVHAYVESWLTGTVEHYLDQLPPFLDAVDRTCGLKPIWINEAGFPTSGGRTERDQSIWWIRAVATFLAHPRVEEIGVYEIKDLKLGSAAIGDAINYHLGITYSNRRKKLAFGTITRLVQLLGTGTIRVDDAELQVKVAAGSPRDLHYHLFTRPDGDRVLFVWDRAGAPTVTIGAGAVGSITEFDVSGAPVSSTKPSMLNHVTLTAGVPRTFRLRR